MTMMSSRGRRDVRARSRGPGTAVAVAVGLAAFLAPRGLDAQRTERAPFRSRRVDIEVIHATGSWLFPVSTDWAVGPELGVGLLEQKTYYPSEDDFTSLIHVGAVASGRRSREPTFEVGARVGLAELRSRSCSGCLPELYGALTSAVFVGSGLIRGGSRITVGRVVTDGFFSWSPVILRFRF